MKAESEVGVIRSNWICRIKLGYKGVHIIHLLQMSRIIQAKFYAHFPPIVKE